MHKKIIITGTSKGIGKYLAEYYSKKGHTVFGCSRSNTEIQLKNYYHYCLDVSSENDVKNMFNNIRTDFGYIDILINNAGIASMNHSMLTKMSTVQKILSTNVAGTFLFCREAAKLMQKNRFGRIVNFTTIAVPLAIEGEAIYASSKAAVINLTKILAKEFGSFGITVNAIGPTPIKTDLIKGVPENKIKSLISRQAIKRYGQNRDVVNVINFFTNEKSGFITGQTIFLGGI